MNLFKQNFQIQNHIISRNPKKKKKCFFEILIAKKKKQWIKNKIENSKNSYCYIDNNDDDDKPYDSFTSLGTVTGTTFPREREKADQ